MAKLGKLDLKEFKRFKRKLENAQGDALCRKVLNRLGGEVLAHAKLGTPRDTGELRRAWRADKITKQPNGFTKVIHNPKEYAPYVEYGHRIVNSKKETVGWVEGVHMLDKAVALTESNSTVIIRGELKKFADAMKNGK